MALNSLPWFLCFLGPSFRTEWKSFFYFPSSFFLFTPQTVLCSPIPHQTPTSSWDDFSEANPIVELSTISNGPNVCARSSLNTRLTQSKMDLFSTCHFYWVSFFLPKLPLPSGLPGSQPKKLLHLSLSYVQTRGVKDLLNPSLACCQFSWSTSLRSHNLSAHSVHHHLPSANVRTFGSCTKYKFSSFINWSFLNYTTQHTHAQTHT